MVKFTELINGQRYMVSFPRKDEKGIVYYRANYKTIRTDDMVGFDPIQVYIIVNNVVQLKPTTNYNYLKQELYLSFYVTLSTLSEILGNTSKIPLNDDVLMYIDSYL